MYSSPTTPCRRRRPPSSSTYSLCSLSKPDRNIHTLINLKRHLRARSNHHRLRRARTRSRDASQAHDAPDTRHPTLQRFSPPTTNTTRIAPCAGASRACGRLECAGSQLHQRQLLAARRELPQAPRICKTPPAAAHASRATAANTGSSLSHQNDGDVFTTPPRPPLGLVDATPNAGTHSAPDRRIASPFGRPVEPVTLNHVR